MNGEIQAQRGSPLAAAYKPRAASFPTVTTQCWLALLPASEKLVFVFCVLLHGAGDQTKCLEHATREGDRRAHVYIKTGHVSRRERTEQRQKTVGNRQEGAH